jgi:hypothetical protein
LLCRVPLVMSADLRKKSSEEDEIIDRKHPREERNNCRSLYVGGQYWFDLELERT